jgi:hypothetical protein
MHKQCTLKGVHVIPYPPYMTVWLPEKFAREGALLKLEDRPKETWQVVRVFSLRQVIDQKVRELKGYWAK